MKKSILFMSAVAMLAAASCNKPELENVGTTPEVGANEFVAYTESATKTTLNGYTTVWEAGDEIAINGIAYMTSEGGERAIFTLNDENEPEAPYLAGYPYGNVMESDVTAITFAYLNNGNELALTRNHIGDEVFAMAYNESDRSLEFKNVVSLLKFQVPSTFAEEITSITISTNEPLAGYFTAEYNNGVPTWTISEGSASVNEIILTDEKGAFSSEATYFVPVLPGDKTNLTVKLNETVVATGISISLERNVIHNVAVLPSALKWAVAGEFNGWNTSATPLVKDGDYYVARNITKLNSENGFKFIKDGVWRGAEGETAVNEWVYVWGDGNNISVTGATEDTAYDIYVNPSAGDYGKFVIVPAGSEMPKDVPAWAIAGSFNGWDITATPMVKEGDFYVAKNVSGLNYTENTEDGEGSSTGFKFVTYGTDWKGSVGKMTTNTWQYVWDTDNGDNIYVEGAAATTLYDIYVNPSEGNNGKFVIVPAGESVPEDKPAGPVAGIDSEWAVYAQFGSETWTEVVMKTTSQEGLYVVENKTMSAYNGLLIKKYQDNWTVKYGASGVNYIKSNRYFTVISNGGNIFVEAAGTYDIYFDSTNKYVYLMSTGTDYTEATKQTANGNAPAESNEKTIYLNTGGSGLWDQGGATFVAWIWGDGDQWVTFKPTNESGIYSAVVPKGTTGMICFRKGPGMANGWTKDVNYWNRTKGDITLNGKNCIKITNWGSDGNSTWSLSNK